MMDLLQRFYAYIMNWNLPKEQFDPNNVICTLDDKQVNCETWEETNDN